jgi:hypothetical protein
MTGHSLDLIPDAIRHVDSYATGYPFKYSTLERIRKPIVPFALLFSVFLNILPDYLSLLLSRWLLFLLMPVRSAGLTVCILFSGLLFCALSGTISESFGDWFSNPYDMVVDSVGGPPPFSLVHDNTLRKRLMNLLHPFGFATRRPDLLVALWYYPAFFPAFWLWLYAGSGFLLKGARRFDLGFDWFNRKFDIEKHPLQSIGLVAGAIEAVVYWVAVGISRVL